MEEGVAVARGEGFGGGVMFVAVNPEDNGAVVFDVAGELGGGVTGFVKRAVQKVVV